MPTPRSTASVRRGLIRLTFVGAVLLALLVNPPAAAAAQDDDERIEVVSFEIEGVAAFDESTLKSVLGTQASGWIPWGEKHYFDRETFEADLKRLEAFYVDRGYPDARVASFDVDLSDDQRSVALRVVLDEGAPVIVASVHLEGLDVLPELRLERLARELPLQAGDPLDRLAVEASRAAVARELRNQGYPLAEVSARRDTAPEGQAIVTLDATPGERALVGPIAINGNMTVDARTIERALDLEPGELFRLSALSQSQRRLYDLELFEFVNVEARTGEMEAGAVPVRITVAEADQRQLRFSGGYGSEERLRGEAGWRHVNFFGGARSAGVEGKWSSLDRGVRLDLRQPFLLRPDMSLSVSTERWFSDEPAYELDTKGGRVAVTRQISAPDAVTDLATVTTLSGSVIYEAEEFAIANDALNDLSFRDELIALGLDPRTGVGRGRLTAVAFDVRRSTTANLLDSRRGYVFVAHIEQGGGWLPGDFQYLETTIELRHYLTLGRFGVFANRGRVGGIDARGPLAENVPFFKRYFLGGSNSLRGWGRFEVAPLSGSGLPLGGHTMLELSSELRVPVFGNLGLVAFVDAGNAWSGTWDLDLSTLRYDAGPGLRYLTPIGPVRVDLAFQVNPLPNLLIDGEPESRHWRLHFNIGQAF